MSGKPKAKHAKPINYSLDSQKITFDFLKAHLWNAADILRGSLDASEYRQPVMTLLFLKRLNDTFEENAEKLVKQGKTEKEAWENKRRHIFFIPKQARWSVLSSAADNRVMFTEEEVNELLEFHKDRVITVS